MPLSIIPLPLPPNGPPSGYGWEERDISALSTTTAFNTGIDRRDTFLGQRRCIVKPDLTMLKERHWIPEQAKSHMSRAMACLCAAIVTAACLTTTIFLYVISPMQIRKFVFVNYSGACDLQQFHGKAVALDISNRYVPFPSLFIIHEMRVRGFHPFRPITPDMPAPILWQDWILSDGVFDNTSNSFIHDRPPANNNVAGLGRSQLQLQPTTSAGGGGGALEVNDAVVEGLSNGRHELEWYGGRKHSKVCLDC
ncbi:hypothetical protein M422DRAFT_243986 [Sphaerobolus stellatus SS14]|nr:hypothetical protein M422DRAFT_243986 [Sphaerobolus stellatus SS14]